jgi:hypothetical protein
MREVPRTRITLPPPKKGPEKLPRVRRARQWMTELLSLQPHSLHTHCCKYCASPARPTPSTPTYLHYAWTNLGSTSHRCFDCANMMIALAAAGHESQLIELNTNNGSRATQCTAELYISTAVHLRGSNTRNKY